MLGALGGTGCGPGFLRKRHESGAIGEGVGGRAGAVLQRVSFAAALNLTLGWLMNP
jgi:hypothetical protein